MHRWDKHKQKLNKFFQGFWRISYFILKEKECYMWILDSGRILLLFVIVVIIFVVLIVDRNVSCVVYLICVCFLCLFVRSHLLTSSYGFTLATIIKIAPHYIFLISSLSLSLSHLSFYSTIDLVCCCQKCDDLVDFCG